jgi:2-oxo-4-hydroxy-4-carboxy--5-ureidoimidazoline (OHCU) decarboxylase
MLTELRERIVNHPATEFENAKREQRKITALRLRTAFSSWEIPSRAIPT